MNSIKVKVLIYFLTFIIRGEVPFMEKWCEIVSTINALDCILLSGTFTIKVAKLSLVLDNDKNV